LFGKGGGLGSRFGGFALFVVWIGLGDFQRGTFVGSSPDSSVSSRQGGAGEAGGAASPTEGECPRPALVLGARGAKPPDSLRAPCGRKGRFAKTFYGVASPPPISFLFLSFIEGPPRKVTKAGHFDIKDRALRYQNQGEGNIFRRCYGNKIRVKGDTKQTRYPDGTIQPPFVCFSPPVCERFARILRVGYHPYFLIYLR